MSKLFLQAIVLWCVVQISSAVLAQENTATIASKVFNQDYLFDDTLLIKTKDGTQKIPKYRLT
jgi:hypothetical protein